MTRYDEAVPAGRDLTANDVDEAILTTVRPPGGRALQSIADFLNRIARPSGGSRRSCVCGDRRDNDGVTHRTDGPCFQSPRSWSLPAPPPDDVTVVHVCSDRFERTAGGHLWRDDDGQLCSWSKLYQRGTVVEGEPQAAEPDVDRIPTVDDVRRDPKYWISGPGYERARRTRCPHDYNLTDSCPGCDAEGEPPAPEPEYAVSNWVRVPTTDGDTVTVGAPALDRRPHPESRWDTRTETWEPAPEPPRFERGFYRLARDLDTGQGTVAAGEQVFVACPVSADDTEVRAYATRVRFSFRVSRAALVAAGAERQVWRGDR